jgi:hypothetical protein
MTTTFAQVKAATSQAARIALEHVFYVENANNPVRFFKSETGLWFWSIADGHATGASMKRKDCKAHYEAFIDKARVA